MPWSQETLEAVQNLHTAAEDDAVEPLWEHSTLPEERQLEAAIGNLALVDPRACIAAAFAAAQVALPIVIERGGKEAHDEFDADRPSKDGDPAELQLRRVEAWLSDPSEQNLVAVERSIDPSQQLHIWDDDLTPPSDKMWWWFLEVGQLVALSVERGDAWGYDAETYYDWPSHVCAARAAVCALKAVRAEGGSAADDAKMIERAIVGAFEGT